MPDRLSHDHGFWWHCSTALLSSSGGYAGRSWAGQRRHGIRIQQGAPSVLSFFRRQVAARVSVCEGTWLDHCREHWEREASRSQVSARWWGACSAILNRQAVPDRTAQLTRWAAAPWDRSWKSRCTRTRTTRWARCAAASCVLATKECSLRLGRRATLLLFGVVHGPGRNPGS